MAKKETPPKEKKEPKVVIKLKTPANINEALFALQAENITVVRNGNGSISGRAYKYATLDDTITAIRPVLQKNGIMLSQTMSDSNLITDLIHVESNTKIQSSLPLGAPATSQDLGSRITYLRRYMLTAMLGLNLEDDVDGTQSAGIKASVAPPVASHGPQNMAPVQAKEAEFGVFGEQNPPKPAAAPVEPPKAATPAATPVALPLDKSENFIRAQNKIEACLTIPALNHVGDAVTASVKLTDAEKVELKTIISAKMDTMDPTE